MNAVVEAMDGGLPGGLADPLHFPDAAVTGWLPALLLLALLWLLSRWGSRRYLRTERAPSPPAPSSPVSHDPLLEALSKLRKRHLARKTYRRGCHELAVLLRGHFERLGSGAAARLPWTRLTAREIRQRTGDLPAVRLLSHLAALRFGRDEPGRDDFEGAWRQATDLALGERRRRGRRQGRPHG
jgi:hypothetical protein